MSRYSRYLFRDASINGMTFEFTSIGPKEEIKKIVQFTPIKAKDIFILSFGNINEDGTIDDITTNDNKDRDKILTTIADILNTFTKTFPSSFIFFSGSTKDRTRLYRMALTINYTELSEIYEIWGITEDGNPESFEKQSNYSGFLIKRK